MGEFLFLFLFLKEGIHFKFPDSIFLMATANLKPN